MRKRRVLSLVLAGIVAVMLFPGSAAEADPNNLNKLLRGDYAFSGETTCLVSIGGFDPDLTPANPPAPFPFVVSFSIQGVRTFNGDGSGKIVGRTVTLSHPYALPLSPTPFFSRGGASSSDIDAAFTYQVAPDRTFTAVTTLVNGTVLAGSRAGQTFTVVPIPLVGQISHDNKTLTTASEEPTLETQSFSNGDVQYRICHRSRIHLKLKSAPGGNDD